QLKTQANVLSPDKQAEIASQIQEKQKSAERFYQDTQEKVSKRQNEIANRIGGKMLGVIDNFAKMHGYAVIIDVSAPQSPVLWATPQGGVVTTKEPGAPYNPQSGVPAHPKPAAPTAAPRPAGTTARSAGTAAPKPAGTTPR